MLLSELVRQAQGIPLLTLHTRYQLRLHLLAHSHSPNRAEEAGDFLKVLR